MASIFRATDLRTGRQVAIKVPHPEMESDPVFFERFQREQEIGAKLDHPGVMKVFTDEDRSQVYMVMEWVDGPAAAPSPERAAQVSRRARAAHRARAFATRWITSTPTASCTAT